MIERPLIFCFVVCRFVLSGDSLNSAVSAVSYSGWIGLSLVIVLPLSYLKHVHHLGYASVFACITYLSLLVLVIEHGIAGSVTHSPARPDVPIIFTTEDGTTNFLLSFGIIKFCFAGHEVFLTIEQNLADHTTYNRVITMAFTGMILINCAMSVAGYAVFGVDTQPIILSNFSASGIGYAARLLVGGMLCVTVPIVLLAAFEMVEEIIWSYLYIPYFWKQPSAASADANASAGGGGGGLPRVDSAASFTDHTIAVPSTEQAHSLNDDATQPSPLLRKHLPAANAATLNASNAASAAPSAAPNGDAPPKDMSLLARIAIRTPLTAVSAGIAIGLPSFAKVVGVVGAIGDSTIGLILPVLFYLLIHRQLRKEGSIISSPHDRWISIANAMVLGLGTIGLVSGVAILWT